MPINRNKVIAEYQQEIDHFKKKHPKSQELYKRAKKSLLKGHANIWQNMLPGDLPVYVQSAGGCRFTDVDENEYVDFCLGDTGAMTGHSPVSLQIIAEKFKTGGTTFMLPSEDHIWVAEELTRRFGMARWQYALSASDANRFAIRYARFVTGRNKILVFNHCYHGTVDETLAQLYDGNLVGPKEGNLAPPVNPKETTKVVEFNDIDAVRKALADRDVAVVLTEPALTNMSIVLPNPGFLDELRKITRETGTLLLIDETHTISEGTGGFTQKFNLDPDIFVVGKPIGSGIPVGVYGFSEELAKRIEQKYPQQEKADVLGTSTTLTGNNLAAIAVRATLEHVLTEANYEKMFRNAKRFADGVQSIFDEYELPWRVILLGSRLEYIFDDVVPQNGSDVYNAFHDHELSNYIHLGLLNRGIFITPFHNMALMCPDTTAADVDCHTEAFREIITKVVD